MDLATKTQALAAMLCPVIEDLGYEFVDLHLKTEHGRQVLRLLVDRPGGITLGECATLSREVSPHLDVSDPLRGNYVLEVSSPGIQRPLKRTEDFERFRGEQVVVKTGKLIDGRKTFRGTNLGLDTQGSLMIEDRETGRSFAISLDDVLRAHLDPEIRF
jgi:ribosome maturation factor RimP